MRRPRAPWEARALLEGFQLTYPFSETSGFRSPGRNALVGGSPMSKHLVGAAVDIVLDDMSDARRAAFVREIREYFWVMDEGDHIHVQWLPPGPVPWEWRGVYRLWTRMREEGA